MEFDDRELEVLHDAYVLSAAGKGDRPPGQLRPRPVSGWPRRAGFAVRSTTTSPSSGPRRPRRRSTSAS